MEKTFSELKPESCLRTRSWNNFLPQEGGKKVGWLWKIQSHVEHLAGERATQPGESLEGTTSEQVIRSPVGNGMGGTSLVVQWLKIGLPMQGTWVQFLVGELISHIPWSN